MSYTEEYYKTIESKINELTKNGVQEITTQQITQLGAICVAQIGTQFFLLVEIENAGEQVFVIRISATLAAALLASGVEACQIVTEIPTPAPGREVELICVFVVGVFAFLVFDVETATTDRLVLVRVPLCPVISIGIAEVEE